MRILPYRLLRSLSFAPKQLLLRMARRKNVVLFVVMVSLIVASLPSFWRLAEAVSNALMLPTSPQPSVTHFIRNRNMRDYLDAIGDPIVEPLGSACETLSDISVLILVASIPHHTLHRTEIRRTWSKSQPTFFVMGMWSHNIYAEDLLYMNKREAKLHNDIIVFEFWDHYQNLTLKTALMLQWVSSKCPQARIILKTDEDVFVNPWTLQEVIREHSDSEVIGYRVNNTKLHRDPYNKYYVPQWLIRDNWIDQYLSGTGYLVKGRNINRILQSSYNVSLVNIEDVYITYLVAKRYLNLTLTHDSRLNPARPWFPFTCSYWRRAIIHNVKPIEVGAIWAGLKHVAQYRMTNKALCNESSVFKRDFSVLWQLLY